MQKLLIVGGNSGIGLELGKQLLDQGVELIQWSRQEGTLANLGAKFSSLDLNEPLPDPPDSLDGLVYLPGTISLKPFERIKESEFLSDMQVNALGAAKVLQALRGALMKAKAPSVVLFSTVAVNTGFPYHTSVAMAKGALEGLTRSLAAEWAPHVRVNAIAPSLTDTPLASQFLNSESKRSMAQQRHPLKALGDPSQIASLARFLLSSEASFITGQILAADGGLGTIRT